MKLAKVKGMVAKVMVTGLAAGAILLAGPAKADAQRVAFGVGFGYPAPPPVVVGYPRYGYPQYDRFAFERREAFGRHEEWLRFHRFHGYGYR